ncbi:MAG: hypothetical protein ACI82Q_001691, partial [Nonlabens sp.]
MIQNFLTMNNNKKSAFLLLLLSIWMHGCSAPIEKVYTDVEIASASKKANDFFEKNFNEAIDRSPMSQGFLGIKTDNDKWDDASDANSDNEFEIVKKDLQYLLDSINPDALDLQTRLSYQLFKEGAENQISDYKWRYHNYPITQMFGAHTQVATFLINIHSIADASDAVAYISRINGVPKY